MRMSKNRKNTKPVRQAPFSISPPIQKVIEKHPPWYETNLFWGSFGAFMAVVLAAVATVLKDVRWLLWFAFPFGCLACWAFTRSIVLIWVRRVVLVISPLLLMSGLWLLYGALKQPTEIHLTNEQQSEFTNILKTSVGVPTYTRIACPDADEAACIYAATFIPLFQRAGWKVEGPALERVRLGRPSTAVTIVHYGPPLVNPQNPDQGVWTQLTPWDQLLRTAFKMIGITPDSVNDPQLSADRIRIYFGSAPKK
jgi:hypothetical protein